MNPPPKPHYIRVHGNSMNRAGLRDGMRVRVRACTVASHRDVVVVRQEDGGLIVKRYWQTRPYNVFRGGWLVPDSTDPTYQPRPLLDGDHIIGVVVDQAGRDRDRRMARLRALLQAPTLVRARNIPQPPPRVETPTAMLETRYTRSGKPVPPRWS